MAQYKLGLAYANGEGVSKNTVQAYMWLDVAGQTGEKARELIGKLTAEMTPQQVSEAQRISREWKPKK